MRRDPGLSEDKPGHFSASIPVTRNYATLDTVPAPTLAIYRRSRDHFPLLPVLPGQLAIVTQGHEDLHRHWSGLHPLAPDSGHRCTGHNITLTLSIGNQYWNEDTLGHALAST